MFYIVTDKRDRENFDLIEVNEGLGKAFYVHMDGPYQYHPHLNRGEEIGPTHENWKEKIYGNPLTSSFLRLKEIEQAAGTYYPRIFRPLIFGRGRSFHVQNPNQRFVNEQGNQRALPFQHVGPMITSVQQLSSLIKLAENIFKTVYPAKDQVSVYGNEIRNLLILICTEIEAQFKGILLENGFEKTGKHFRMTNYHKLLNPLRLLAYGVSLNYYQDFGHLRPYDDWEEHKNPFWYTNYNKTKHDRVNSFKDANLNSIINALAALHILLVAQYGPNIFGWNDLIGDYFVFNSTASFTVEEAYLPPFQSINWTAEKYFSSNLKS